MNFQIIVGLVVSSSFLAVAFSQNCSTPDICGNDESTSYPEAPIMVTLRDREAMVNRHNAFRSKLAKGFQLDRLGRRNPPGRNMYKLVWDYRLEREAQAWSNRCVFQHSSSSQRRGAGENLFAQGGRSMDAYSNFLAAANSWWSEANTAWTARANNRFTGADMRAGHFTQMAWGKTYKIGCGVSACRGIFGSHVAAYVVCRYVDAGNYMNAPVYEPGRPCTGSSACSTGIASRCEASSGLCVIQRSETSPYVLQENIFAP
uniref:SCP domain-containing protein n=1 Tax=Plectus sambesii TaxID=2011161 RepID=A0A914UJI1_9BILA